MPELPKLKLFQVIVIAVFAVIAVAGLFLFSIYQGGSQGVVSVGEVAVWGTLPAEEFNAGLSAYKSRYEAFRGVRYEERPLATFDRDLAEAIATGRGPDLVLISQEQLLESRSKLATIGEDTLDERDFRDRFVPVAELFLSPEGAYGVPALVDPLVLYYDRPTLASSGLARPPATWEALTGLVSARAAGAYGRPIEGSVIALGTYGNVTNARAVLSLLFLQSGHPITERSSDGVRVTLGDASTEAYGLTRSESALNFYTEFANPAKAVYSWNPSLPESRDAFLAGDLAFYPGFASERAGLSRANPNLDFDLAPMPQPGTAGTRTTYGLAYAFAPVRSSGNPAGALRAALALSDTEAAGELAAALGMVPASRDARPRDGSLYEPVYYPEALVSRGWLSPSPAETDRIFGAMVEGVLSGLETEPSAVGSATDALEAAVD